MREFVGTVYLTTIHCISMALSAAGITLSSAASIWTIFFQRAAQRYDDKYVTAEDDARVQPLSTKRSVVTHAKGEN